ncbi:MAG: hypothetical protein AAF467_19970 [Actinomycetota bacterium]
MGRRSADDIPSLAATATADEDWSTITVRAWSGILGGGFLAAMVLVALDVADQPITWIAVGAAAAVGATPALRGGLALRRRRRLHMAGLSPGAVALVVRAATEADRIRALAAAADPGPIADHLTHLSNVADEYVWALQGSLGEPESGTRAVESDATRVIAQLQELSEAAAELRDAQRRLAGRTRLESLTEQTRQLSEAVAEQTDRAEIERAGDGDEPDTPPPPALGDGPSAP